MFFAFSSFFSLFSDAQQRSQSARRRRTKHDDDDEWQDDGPSVSDCFFIVLLLNPITPHICLALWEHLGHAEPIIAQPWPQVDAQALAKSVVTLAVQVNGKLRGQIEVAVDAVCGEIEKAALAEPGVAKFLEGLSVKKIIVVPGKIVNIVVG